MKKMWKRALALLLATASLFLTVSCNGDKTTETEKESSTGLSTEELAALNAAALEDFIQKYRSGYYSDLMMFQYESIASFLEMGTYKGLVYPDDPALSTEVTDEEVNDYLTGIQIVGTLTDSAFTDLAKGDTVQKFDYVTIDYRGVMNGEEIDNASSSGEELLLGSNQFMPGFESGLIGKEVGKEVQLDLVFSPYYSDFSVAGQPITFYVTIREARRPTLTEMTVETVNAIYGSNFATMDEVKEDIRKYLKNSREDSSATGIISYLENTLLKSFQLIAIDEKFLGFLSLLAQRFYL